MAQRGQVIHGMPFTSAELNSLGKELDEEYQRSFGWMPGIIAGILVIGYWLYVMISDCFVNEEDK